MWCPSKYKGFRRKIFVITHKLEFICRLSFFGSTAHFAVDILEQRPLLDSQSLGFSVIQTKYEFFKNFVEIAEHKGSWKTMKCGAFLSEENADLPKALC